MSHAASTNVKRACKHLAKRFIEVDEVCEKIVEACSVGVGAAPRRAWRGSGLRRYLDASGLLPDGTTVFYLAGHVGTIGELRHVLLRRGWPRRCVCAKAYWDDGRRGL